ncbi:MAG: NYN domain-containing protein [Ilumatobacteraceae bacterium]|nr:NYN domain-containing protein [Ilumatobacteraceae bacterium]
MSTEPADVPGEALRSALEFAVGIAAAGAKLRPPLPFPAELKRFLRFHKLPPTALIQVRAAIEGDEDFRKRLASVATTELMDEVGVLWLTRPEGWARSIADLMPEKIVDDAAALRREERRRVAAQEAAARGRAELLGLTGELERERAAKAALTADADRLRSELVDLRQRLRETQRAEHATAQALAKAEGELVDLRRNAEAPIQPPAPAVIDTAAAKGLLEDAVSASTDIVRMLTEALGELASADADVAADVRPPVRPTRARRKPIRLPGGVFTGTLEAAEFLLRVKGAERLIDGYNVAKLGWPLLDLDQQREQCILAVENIAKRWNMSITIVFDGASVEGAHASARRKVRIVYSPAGVSADDVLRAEVAAADVAKPVVVVTNDRAIITDVVAAGANTVSSNDFLYLLRR